MDRPPRKIAEQIITLLKNKHVIGEGIAWSHEKPWEEVVIAVFAHALCAAELRRRNTAKEAFEKALILTFPPPLAFEELEQPFEKILYGNLWDLYVTDDD